MSQASIVTRTGALRRDSAICGRLVNGHAAIRTLYHHCAIMLDVRHAGRSRRHALVSTLHDSLSEAVMHATLPLRKVCVVVNMISCVYYM